MRHVNPLPVPFLELFFSLNFWLPTHTLSLLELSFRLSFPSNRRSLGPTKLFVPSAAASPLLIPSSSGGTPLDTLVRCVLRSLLSLSPSSHLSSPSRGYLTPCLSLAAASRRPLVKEETTIQSFLSRLCHFLLPPPHRTRLPIFAQRSHRLTSAAPQLQPHSAWDNRVSREGRTRISEPPLFYAKHSVIRTFPTPREGRHPPDCVASNLLAIDRPFSG